MWLASTGRSPGRPTTCCEKNSSTLAPVIQGLIHFRRLSVNERTFRTSAKSPCQPPSATSNSTPGSGRCDELLAASLLPEVRIERQPFIQLHRKGVEEHGDLYVLTGRVDGVHDVLLREVFPQLCPGPIAHEVVGDQLVDVEILRARPRSSVDAEPPL